MNIIKKLHLLLDLAIEANKSAIKGHNAAYESFKESREHAFRYYQTHLRNERIEHDAREAEYKYLENKDRDKDEQKRFIILTAINNISNSF